MNASTSQATDPTDRLDYFHPDVVKKFEAAVATHQAGDLDVAEKAYREILRLTVDHPGALNLIGTLYHQKGDHEAAIEFHEKAIEIAPGNPDFYGNQGAAYFSLGDYDNAEECFRTALSYQPDDPGFNSNMASILMEQKRVESAHSLARKAFDASPNTFKYAKRLGDICLQSDRFEEAVEAFGACAEIAPENAEIVNNLGYSYERLGDLEKTEKWYRAALELRPTSPEIMNNLAGALVRLDKKDEAQKYYDEALAAPVEEWSDALKMAVTLLNAGDYARALHIFDQLTESRDDDAHMWSSYGAALSAAGRLDEADAAFKKSIELEPLSAEIWNSLATNTSKNQKTLAAVDQYKQAIELSPSYPDPYINLCLTLMFLGRIDEAYMYAHMTLNLPRMREGIFANPVKIFRGVCDYDALEEVGDIFELAEEFRNTDIMSSFLAMLPESGTAEQNQRLADLHYYWAENLARPEGTFVPLPPRSKKAGSSKLKIGFLSSDLRSHSVANFVLPILRHYDRSQFEIQCFTPVDYADDKKQAVIRDLVDDFRVLDSMNFRDAAETIQNEHVDVLVELNGFTRNTMIRSLCYQPAPVQIYWLGYPFTTGMAEMDHILVDKYVAPEDTGWLAEEPLYMPESWLCVDSFPGEAISEQLPVETSGKLTFGTLNNTYKFTRESIAVWATIMNEFEDSEFLLVRPEADSLILQNNLREHFARCGVAPERIRFINNRRSSESHFWYYNLIDISLDTFPQTGGTTTCDALWMGVPVISLVGPSMHQRVSYSMLENAGCGELACFSLEEYMGKAVMLGNDIASLREYRHNLRPALLNSPLCQGERFAQNFQNAVVGAYEKSGA
ncbi:MAG: protein O-GlcNAc transferase [Paracoccaceae bacterium]|jgi:protein O-GlcNAc transferase